MANRSCKKPRDPVKRATQQLTGISVREIMITRDSTTARQVMGWLRVRGYNYEQSLKALAATADAEDYPLNAGEWDELLREGE